MEEVEFRDGIEYMKFDEVTRMLASSYWCPGIGIDDVKKEAENSALVVGAFLGQAQIGYARVISDKSRFAYISDVYVDENQRGKGIGQKLIQYILNHREFKDVYQWLLVTKDAHEVYRKVGFEAVSRPLDWMEIRKPKPKR